MLDGLKQSPAVVREGLIDGSPLCGLSFLVEDLPAQEGLTVKLERPPLLYRRRLPKVSEAETEAISSAPDRVDRSEAGPFGPQGGRPADWSPRQRRRSRVRRDPADRDRRRYPRLLGVRFGLVADTPTSLILQPHGIDWERDRCGRLNYTPRTAGERVTITRRTDPSP